MPCAARLLDVEIRGLDPELARSIKLEVQLLVPCRDPRVEHRSTHVSALPVVAPTNDTLQGNLWHCQRHCAIKEGLWHPARTRSTRLESFCHGEVGQDV